MDAQIIINSIDQTAYLLSISRSYNYCSVSQEFTLELDLSCPTTINTYDTVTIYEEGVKVLTGYVSNIIKRAPEAKLVIKGQDVYVKASDFFVPETYTTTFGQTVAYWCTFLLDFAGLTPVFTDGNGPYVIAEQEIGLAPVADILSQMLQYAGWYGRVDPEGTVIFGKVDKIPLSDQIIEGTNILSDEIDKSYDKTRNKAVVFGGINTVLNLFEQIISVSEVDMPVLPVDQTVVIGNPLISDQDSADDFSQALVNEFAKLTQIKNIKVLGNPNFQAGKYVEVHSDIFTGFALITSMRSDFSESGYTMDLILDDPCPRIVGAIKHQPELYAGTAGNGVWAYNLYSGAWEDISSGLTNLFINDLSVDNGLFITATPAGIYTKLASNPWVYQTLPLYSGMIGTLTYSGVYSNLFDNQVHAIVTSMNDGPEYAYFYTGTIASGGTGFVWSGAPIAVSGVRASGLYYAASDLEGNYSTKHITAVYDISGNGEKTYYIVDGTDVYSADPFGENNAAVSFTNQPNGVGNVVPSHALDALVMSLDFGDGYQIYKSNTDGTGLTQLTNLTDPRYPTWSLNDNKIAFVADVGSDGQIYVMNIDGSSPQYITSFLGDKLVSYPIYISDNVIAFSRENDGDPYINIYAINVETQVESRLTTHEFDEYTYRYDENQLKALYVTNANDPLNDFYQPAQASTSFADQEILADNLSSSAINSPNLLDDGRFLMYETNGEIWAAGMAYNETFALNNVGNASFANILNSNTVVFANSNDLYKIGIDGTNEVHVEDPIPPLRMNLMHLNSGFCTTRVFYTNFDLVNDADGRNNTGWKYYDGSSVTTLPNLSYPTDTNFQLKFVSGGPAPNSDGTKLLGIASRNGTNLNCDVFEVDVATGIMTRLTTRDDGFTNYTKAGNSSMVRLGYNSDDSLRAHTYDTQVYINEVYTVDGIFLDWIPNSNTFCYLDPTAAPKKIYTYNYDTSSSSLVYTLNTDSGSDVWVIRFSGVKVTEEKLIYVTEYSGTITNLSRVYVAKLGTGQKESLSSSPIASYALDWTTNGDGILHVGSSSTSQRLYITSPNVMLFSGTKPFHRVTSAIPQVRLFETFDNSTFELIYKTYDQLLENNFDTFIPTIAYGYDGGLYSTDYFLSSGILFSGLEIFDVAGRSINTTKTMFTTTPSGIYATIVSGQPIRKNTIAATEIVSRYYGSGEIFFSVGAEVKESLTDCATYTDISSGLPGSTITVLRLDK